MAKKSTKDKKIEEAIEKEAINEEAIATCKNIEDSDKDAIESSVVGSSMGKKLDCVE